MKAIPSYILMVLLCTLFVACENKIGLNSDGTPNTLIVGVFAGDDPENTIRKLDDIGEYMSKKLGMKVEYIQTSDYTAVIEALRSKKVHMAHMSPFSYVLATEKIDLNLLVAMGVNGKPRSYKSLIFTHKGSGLKNMDDVKARAKKLTLSFSDPASTSGHLIPRAYLTSIGLDPETAFKQTLFSSSNGASLMTVKAGKVDIGCSWENGIQMLVKKGMLKEDDIVILWESDPIITAPIVMRNDINKDFAQKVRQAYLDMAKEEPDIFKNYLRLYYNGDITGFGYIHVKDSMYEGIRKIAAGIKDVNAFQ
jgi:phosphonate transport system substrate-binding protein